MLQITLFIDYNSIVKSKDVTSLCFFVSFLFMIEMKHFLLCLDQLVQDRQLDIVVQLIQLVQNVQFVQLDQIVQNFQFVQLDQLVQHDLLDQLDQLVQVLQLDQHFQLDLVVQLDQLVRFVQLVIVCYLDCFTSELSTFQSIEYKAIDYSEEVCYHFTKTVIF